MPTIPWFARQKTTPCVLLMPGRGVNSRNYMKIQSIVISHIFLYRKEAPIRGKSVGVCGELSHKGKVPFGVSESHRKYNGI